jgi:hypothetical protein
MSQITMHAPHTATDNSQLPQPDAVRDVPGVSEEAMRVSEPALRSLDAALAHRTPLNRHRTALLRAAGDMQTAFAAYSMLNHLTVTSGNLPAATDDGVRCINCWIKGYVDRGWIEPDDGLALDTALTSVARRAVGFPIPPTDDEMHLLGHDPRALVRAAYALARDMAA